MMSSVPKQAKFDPDAWRKDPALFRDILTRGFERATKKAIASHHREGRSVPIWRDGKIMYLNSDGSVTEQDPTPKTAVSTCEDD